MTAHKSSSKRLTRREMLKLSGALGAGSLLAACAPATTPAPTAVPPTSAPASTAVPAPTEIPTAAPPQGEVTIMHQRNELSEDQEAQFETDNPGITINFINADETRFFAMYAAGTPPDLLRTQAAGIPQFLARKILYDLTPYFEVSTALKPDDLAPANNFYKANSPLDIGAGKYYGMVKDWSPDETIFIYKPLFDAAGAAIPDDTQPLTYDEVYQLAQKTAKFEGDRIVTWAYGHVPEVDRLWINHLAEVGEELYADSYTRVNLKASDNAKKVIQYYFDLAKNNLVANPVNPSPSWNGEDFTKGTLAMVQWGYWFSAMAESDVTKGQVMMLPAPTWAGQRRDPTITATGMIMSAASQVPDAAWKVFEWYNGLAPAVDRAKSGWGVPGLKSMYNLMPTESDFQKQANKVLMGEMPYSEATFQYNPFIGRNTVADSWAKNLDQALRGTLDFDGLVGAVESDINAAIKDGIDRMG